MKFLPTWIARLTVAAVFVMNVSCALAFIFQPDRYAGGFEVSGAAGRVIVQGFGILFLMWNATYPPVILQPAKQKTLFIIILIQQTIGVAGESWFYLQLPAGHSALRAAGLRFIFFDGLGLVLLSIAYGWLMLKRPFQTKAALA